MTLFVIDASNHNPGLPVESLTEQGFAALILKCSEGASFVDPLFGGYVQRARACNLPVAAYHFLHPGAASTQAVNCARVVPADIPIWLDAEGGATRDDAYAVGAELRRLGRVVAGIYHGAQPKAGWGGWWRAAYLSDPAGNAVSTYRAQGGDSGRGWLLGVDLWQFCQHGRIAGVSGDVDFSAFRGTLPDLLSRGWFHTRVIDPITITREVPMLIIKTPSNGSFALWPDGDHMAYVGVDEALAARWVSGGIQQVNLGAADATALMHLQAAVQDVITVPQATVDVAALAAELVPLLPPGTTLTAEHLADVLAARMAQ